MSAGSVLSPDECREVVRNYIRREDFEVKSFTMSPLSAEVKGVLGDHLRLYMWISVGDHDTDDVTTISQLKFFVKLWPEDVCARYHALSTLAYQKEVLFFGDFLREVRKHLRCAEESSSTLLGTVPRCYYLRPDLLVLEDLSLVGFRMLDSVEPLSVGQCEYVLKALARLHGASLVYEEREGRRLADAYPLLLQETIFCKEHGFPLYDTQISCIRMTHVLLDLVTGLTQDSPHYEEFHHFVDPVMFEIYDLFKPSDKYRNVLCHRELWVNNMLFAEDEKGELSVRLVDFQSLHLEPPAYDVMIFLHLCTMRDVRNCHGRRLLELYHQTLADLLRQHELDVDAILPLDVFLESCEDAKRVAVIIAVYTLQINMLPPSEGTDQVGFVLDRTAYLAAAYQNDQRFRQRVVEAIEELVETCFMPRLGAPVEEASQQ